ncbi:MAG TPA: hypothetical protein VKE69_10330 [Planctomycetota bacterium]|nr:hypothetical protein [Planctomycetota bacterium]
MSSRRRFLAAGLLAAAGCMSAPPPAPAPATPMAGPSVPADPTAPSGAARGGPGGPRESVAEMLRRVQSQLVTEQESRARTEQQLEQSRARLDEMRGTLSTTIEKSDTFQAERDAARVQVRQLSEKLVSAALLRAEAERDALVARIAYEKLLAQAAEKGVTLTLEPLPSSAPASRPAEKGQP